jgi:hypothetical protein
LELSKESACISTCGSVMRKLAVIFNLRLS